MKVLTRHAILFVLLIVCAPLSDFKSQTPIEKKTVTGTVSGNIKIKGKATAGITVVLHSANTGYPSPRPTTYQAKTDQDGNYRISNIPPGTYQVTPDAPAFVVSLRSGNGLAIVSEGDSVDGIDFDLTKGGVITGRVTNSEGQPLIEQEINLQPVEYTKEVRTLSWGNYINGSQTDDRGVYRSFGLRQGKYRVSVGPSRRGGAVRQTFYPGVIDVAKAGIVEVTEGGEVKNVDIAVETNDTSETFTVSGRIVDGVTGEPVPFLPVYVTRMKGNYSEGSSGASSANKDGQFKIEKLPAGNYAVEVEQTPSGDVRSDRVSFDITDRDVEGLLIKTYKGASVSGQVLFEGDDKPNRDRLVRMVVEVYVETSAGSYGRGVQAGPDLSFRIGGLREGTANFRVSANQAGPYKGINISRIERNGMIQTRGIEIKDGDQIDGLRIFVSASTGIVRGLVKLENGELPPNSQLQVWLTSTGSEVTRVEPRSALVDSRGRFVVEGLAAGTYEINVSVYIPSDRRRVPSAKQQVTVSDGVATEVTIPLDLTPRP